MRRGEHALPFFVAGNPLETRFTLQVMYLIPSKEKGRYCGLLSLYKKFDYASSVAVVV